MGGTPGLEGSRTRRAAADPRPDSRRVRPATPPVRTPSAPRAPRRAKSKVLLSALVMAFAAGLVATIALPSYAVNPLQRQDAHEYAAELAGPSRDRPMRMAIEQMVRKFFHESDHKRWAKVMEFFTNFPTVISDLDQPGGIYRGKAAAIDCLKLGAEAIERTVLRTIVVDRGRVTCHTINFYIISIIMYLIKIMVVMIMKIV